MSYNLNERIYQSDFHDHIELFYSAAKRSVGGNAGRRTQSKKSDLSAFKTNKQQTIVFHHGKSSKKLSDLLIKKAESTERSLRRTRAEMTRFYNTRLYGHHVRFVTLTYAVAPESETQARKDLYSCIERLTKATGKTIHWLAVPEHGSKKGRFHWHVLLNCSYIRNEEFQKEYWRKGFVKLERVKKKKGYTMDNAALFYIMKYIQKDFAESSTWKHRYFRSRGHKVTQHINAYRCSTADLEKFCKYLETQRFTLEKTESWKDEELGLCVRCHYVRNKKETFPEEGIISFYMDFRAFYLTPDSYNFIAPPEPEELADGYCEDFPDFFRQVATPALRKKFYDRAYSVSLLWRQYFLWSNAYDAVAARILSQFGEKEEIRFHNMETFDACNAMPSFERWMFDRMRLGEGGYHNKISA